VVLKKRRTNRDEEYGPVNDWSPAPSPIYPRRLSQGVRVMPKHDCVWDDGGRWMYVIGVVDECRGTARVGRTAIGHRMEILGN
jgi:hypothetical protein